jgi:predicted RNA-binding Zn-ribbon protein involved in translation (DUF1610 family)
MWLTIQATAGCGACGGSTAVNAVVEDITCDGCGALATLRPELWQTVLAELAERGADLAENATASTSIEQAGSTLRLKLSRAAPRCPHCRADWSAEAPAEGFACPECGEDARVRAPPVDAPEVLWIVGEDRLLTAPVTAAESLSCPSCASPLSVDGTARRIACGSCGSEVVLPDELWRRLHAPTATSAWLLWLRAGAGAAAPYLWLRDVAAGSGDVLFGLGSDNDAFACLVSFDTDPMRLRWMVRLADLGLDEHRLIAVAPNGEVLLFGSADRATVERFDPDYGRHLGAVAAPDRGVLAAAADPDGSLLVLVHPTSHLHRIVGGAAQPPWPPSGCLGRLFGLGRGGMMLSGIVARPSYVNPSARFAMGRDGDLRVVLASSLGRLDREGRVRWTVEVPDGVAAMGRPTAAPDGTTWGVFLLQDHQVALVRVDADGRNPTAVLTGGPGEMEEVTVDEQGRVVVVGGGGVRRFDRDGRVLWRWQPA